MANYRLLIFDFDGTLAHTHPSIIATVQQTLCELHLPVVSPEVIAEGIGMEFRDCYRHYVPGIDDATIDACEIVHRRIFATTRLTHPPVLYPHVMETLQALHDQGVTLAIASSRASDELRQLLSDLQIAPFFSVVVGGEQVTHVKPAPEAVLRILDELSNSQQLMANGQRLKANGQQPATLVVGDMDVDIRMGHNAGVRTCAVTYGYGDIRLLREARPDYLIDDMSQLLPLVV